jgi:hypothetical protein
MNTNPTATLFQMAAQFKFRYPYKGMITTEDLWDLSPSQLDVVYKNLNKELKAIDGDSLIAGRSADEGVKANELKNKIEIVKYIFNGKQQAAELARMAAENAAKKQRILEVLAKKQDDAMQNMSEEDLMKMLNELG